MSKVLHIDDLVHPSMGSAISMKPLIDSYILRYNQFAAKDIKIYCIQDKDDYIIHVMVPSEQNSDFDKPVFYDVIFDFYPEKKENKEDLTIKDYGVKVFSNSVSWMFDFTYVFYKSDNIPKFIPKTYLSKDAITKPPKKTNPFGIFGIERVVFIAMYHLEMTTGFRKNRMILINLPNTKTTDIVKRLMGQNEKLEQLNLERKKLSLKNKKNKKIKQTSEINIINRKERETENVVSKLDKNFESNLKGNMMNDMKSTNTKNTFKSNLKSNGLKK